MINIGIDKTDLTFRHFYFDDEQILTSNPPKYKVWYDENMEDVSYILCSNVISLKKKKPEPKPIDEPVIKVEESITAVKLDDNIISTNNVQTFEFQDIVNDAPKRKRGRPKGSTKKQPITNITTHNIEKVVENVKYEYCVISDEFNSKLELETQLNMYGSDGWELCGFEIYKQKLISTNLEILCILKRKIVE